MNIAGPEIVRVRDVGERFGERLGCTPRFAGTERSVALLNNARQSHTLLGKPQMTTQQMIAWTAEWIRRGGESLNKPTHFGSHDGKF
jgi:hypothetical protein